MVRYFLSDLTDLTINGCNLQKFNDTRPLASGSKLGQNPGSGSKFKVFGSTTLGAGALNLASWSRSRAKTGLQNKWIHLEQLKHKNSPLSPLKALNIKFEM